MDESTCNGLMLDTVIFNRILDGEATLSDFFEYRLFATHVQMDELEQTPDQSRRKRLMATFASIRLHHMDHMATTSFCLGVSRLDHACLPYGDELYEKILGALREKDRNSKSRNPDNQWRDSLIAETSIGNKLTLVTDDTNLRNVVKEFGGRAVSLHDLVTGSLSG